MADKQTTLFDFAGAEFRQGYTADSDGTTYDQNVAVRSGSVTPVPSRGSFTDGSGSIAVNATSQQVFAANASRTYLLIQNNSGDTLWINFGVAAVQTQPSFKLFPGGSFESSPAFVSTQTVNIIGPNAGATFTAKQA